MLLQRGYYNPFEVLHFHLDLISQKIIIYHLQFKWELIMTSPSYTPTRPIGDYTNFGVEHFPFPPEPVKPASPKVDESVKTETEKKPSDKLPEGVKNGGVQISAPLSPASKEHVDWLVDHLARCEVSEGLGSP